MPQAKVPSDTVPITGLQLHFHTKQYKWFWARYVKRTDTGTLTIQFFREDPDLLQRYEMQGISHQHESFHKRFKEFMQRLYKAKVTIPERLDISYIGGPYNSYCVLARGYADAPGHVSLLEPLFEELDKLLDEDRS